MEIGEEITVFVKFEEFATNFHRNDFLVCQLRVESRRGAV